MISLNIIDIFENSQLHGMMHQCNCMCTMGGGIARLVAQKFPSAHQADARTKYALIDKLGTFSTQEEEDCNFRIFNCYSQYSFGAGLQTNYEAVEKCFEAVKEYILKKDYIRPYQLGIPYGYGCGLANGDWQTVEGIILKVFSECPQIDIQICKLPI